jgi:hypothetical protein
MKIFFTVNFSHITYANERIKHYVNQTPNPKELKRIAHTHHEYNKKDEWVLRLKLSNVKLSLFCIRPYHMKAIHALHQ